MLCDISKNCGQRANSQRIVPRNRNMMFSVLLSRETYVAARLSCHLIAKNFQRLSELIAFQIAWKFHTAITSSRTKWSRMILGI